ncbi:MAG: NADH-quinone oxidoreductase subunit A [Candidatus Omnitrophica bacterium]|nr:NADH-quinone oxidoreductase subunit A [Candidatus Omnitrophota bacterium]
MEPAYAHSYLFIGLLTLVAVVLGAVPLLLSKLLAPKKPGASKQAPYECGVESTGDSWVQFRVQYYIYALLFVIFDVEIIFLYPWALVWKELGPVVFAEMALFLAILAVALIYAWKKGVLEWE